MDEMAATTPATTTDQGADDAEAKRRLEKRIEEALAPFRAIREEAKRRAAERKKMLQALLERQRKEWDEKAKAAVQRANELGAYKFTMPQEEYNALLNSAARRKANLGYNLPENQAMVQGVVRPILPPPSPDELPIRRAGVTPVRTETEESIYRGLLAKNPRGAMIRAMIRGGGDIVNTDSGLFQQMLDTALETPPEVVGERIRRDTARMNSALARELKLLDMLSAKQLADAQARSELERAMLQGEIAQKLAELRASVDRKRIDADAEVKLTELEAAREAQAAERVNSFVQSYVPQRAAALASTGVSPDTAWQQAAEEAHRIAAQMYGSASTPGGASGAGGADGNAPPVPAKRYARGLPKKFMNYLNADPDKREDLMHFLDNNADTLLKLWDEEPDTVRNFFDNLGVDDEILRAALFEIAFDMSNDAIKRAAKRHVVAIEMGMEPPEYIYTGDSSWPIHNYYRATKGGYTKTAVDELLKKRGRAPLPPLE